MLTRQEFIERSMTMKFKICRPEEIRQRFLKMLEAKMSIMRNSINFTMVNNMDSLMANQKMSANNDYYEFNDYNFNS